MNNEYKIEKLLDPKFYIENFCKIKTKNKGLQKFILNEAQKDLFNTVSSNNRAIILKSRQIGFSSAMTALYYHRTITTPGITTALIGYNSDMTAELLDKIKTFYKTTPEALRPTIQYNSKYEISFPRVDSKILVLPSTENVGRGYTLNNCLCTELSAWEKADEKLMVLEASVPIDGSLVIESTPRGVGNLYHRMWMDDNNGYIKKMYGWWWEYTQEEIDLIKKRMNNPRMFAQEYGLKFLSSGRPVFDAALVEDHRKNILNVGDYVIMDDSTNSQQVYIDKNGLRVYKKPIDHNLYVVGADVAEGIDGGDYSVATIWDRSSGEEVAMYRGHCSADVFGELLNQWGRLYNNALMVPEVNNHGLTTVTILKQLAYPSLYFRQSKIETMGIKYSDKLGWRTTKVTRPLMLDDFYQAFREGSITIHSKEIIDEMTVFVYDRYNNAVPMEGFYDDCIFSSAIALQGFKILYDKKLEQINYNNILPSGYAY